MTLTTEQSAVIHIAKKQLGLSDRRYRNLLFRVAGVRSSKDLDAGKFPAVMLELERQGFRNPNRFYPASRKQSAMIRYLWGEFADGGGDDASLNKWLQRQFRTDMK
ncbi:MAG: phage protein GemA/Gp16 family protein, partial [Methylotetracoccus sp.]